MNFAHLTCPQGKSTLSHDMVVCRMYFMKAVTLSFSKTETTFTKIYTGFTKPSNYINYLVRLLEKKWEEGIQALMEDTISAFPSCDSRKYSR